MNSSSENIAVDLRGFASRLPAGVAVISTCDETGWITGTTMTAVMSLSLDPPLFAVSLANDSQTLDVIRKSGVFCINLLAEDQQDVANTCARKADDKFASLKTTDSVTGAPCLSGTAAIAECRLHSEFVAGDHTILAGELVRTVIETRAPLLYHAGRYSTLAQN